MDVVNTFFRPTDRQTDRPAETDRPKNTLLTHRQPDWLAGRQMAGIQASNLKSKQVDRLVTHDLLLIAKTFSNTILRAALSYKIIYFMVNVTASDLLQVCKLSNGSMLQWMHYAWQETTSFFPYWDLDEYIVRKLASISCATNIAYSEAPWTICWSWKCSN